MKVSRTRRISAAKKILAGYYVTAYGPEFGWNCSNLHTFSNKFDGCDQSWMNNLRCKHYICWTVTWTATWKEGCVCVCVCIYIYMCVCVCVCVCVWFTYFVCKRGLNSNSRKCHPLTSSSFFCVCVCVCGSKRITLFSQAPATGQMKPVDIHSASNKF